MNRWGKRLPRNSLRIRIAAVMVGLTLGLGVVAVFQANMDLSDILEEQLQNRGLAIARDLAARGAPLSQTNDIFGLYQAVNDALLSDRDVRYIFLEEPTGAVRVHTFGDGLPPGLMAANPWDPNELRTVRRIATDEGSILDIAVPILGGQEGVMRVGMSEAGVKNQVASYIGLLSLLVSGAVVGAIALSAAVSSLLTRPLTRIAEAAQRVGGGDLGTKLPADATDELGDLARAFNTMTDDLIRSRESLLRRNTELEILNSMADHLSRQLASEQLLSSSVHHLLELTRLPAAWVCTRDAQGRLVLAASRGVVLHHGQITPQLAAEGCVCWEVCDSGRGQVFRGMGGCPLAADGSSVGEDFQYRAVVPLSSRGAALGVLGAVSRDADTFDDAGLRLLTAVGRQIGTALENAYLYQELERKERSRADLLEKLIGAQEEERRRIAREIHDEPTQALTGILLQLDQVVRPPARLGDEERQGLAQVRRGARGVLDSLQRIMTELRPQALDDLGFVPAIRWYAEQRLGDSGVQIDFALRGRSSRLPPAIEVAAFRIAQEAINNVAKHAEATEVRIRLTFGRTVVRGEVADNGRGFDPLGIPARPAEGAGLGLLGMQERATLLGGSLSVTSASGRGTRVVFKIPC